jgi:hypothetical protein
MPNITIYLDNETYIAYLRLKPDLKAKIREDIIKTIKGR